MIHTFTTMGTVASLNVAGDDREAVPMDAIRGIFASIDARFSLYRPASEANRMARGDVAVAEASTVMLEAYADALEWRGATAGAFTPHRPDGALDLSGIVKAWAMAQAGRALEEAGFGHWLLNVGGDILSAATGNDRPWQAGIVDPQARDRLLCAANLGVHRHAMATSGIAERGEHIWRRTADVNPWDVVQVTVLSSGIIQADVLATAILAGGLDTLDAATEGWDIDALACTRSGELRVTPGLRAMIAGADNR